MSAEEMNKAERLAEMARKMPKQNADYLVGVADGMMRVLTDREEAERNAKSYLFQRNSTAGIQ